nr:hypothetical protein Iba_scaffold14370CG0780 [Ipomoea batatas]
MTATENMRMRIRDLRFSLTSRLPVRRRLVGRSPITSSPSVVQHFNDNQTSCGLRCCTAAFCPSLRDAGDRDSEPVNCDEAP